MLFVFVWVALTIVSLVYEMCAICCRVGVLYIMGCCCSYFELLCHTENQNLRHGDVKTGSEYAVRRTAEVIVEDWKVFSTMVDVSTITKLNLSGDFTQMTDNDTEELMRGITDCISLRILE